MTQTELERLKTSYRQAVRDVAQAKRKYQEANKGGFLLSPTSLKIIGFNVMAQFFFNCAEFYFISFEGLRTEWVFLLF